MSGVDAPTEELIAKSQEAFRVFTEWIWLSNLPFYTNDQAGMFDLAKQIIGFGGTSSLRTLWDIARKFHDPLTEDSFIALLEETLSDQLVSYGLGLKWVTHQSAFESVRLVHFYRRSE